MAIHTIILLAASIALAVGAVVVIIYHGYNAYQFSQAFAGENLNLVTDPGDLEVIRTFETEQRNLFRAFIGLLVGTFVMAGITAVTSDAFLGHPEQANASTTPTQVSNDVKYHLVETVNQVQADRVLGEGDVTTNDNVVQSHVTQVTGCADGYSSPHSVNVVNEAVARADIMNDIFNPATRKGNADAAIGYIIIIIKSLNDEGLMSEMPVAQRLISSYETHGIQAFYETENGKYKVADTDNAFFYNEDGKLVLAIARELFSGLKYNGVGHYQTRYNLHSNGALADADRRIVENPKQYQGDFHIWVYQWKGLEGMAFGTNCGAEGCTGYGDKRPALFAEPEPEPEPGYTPPTGTSGGNPPDGTGGGTPPTGNKDNPPKKNPPTGDQNVKVPDKGSAPSGNAPVGGGKGQGTTPLEDDHPATSTGASSDSGDDDGSSKSSNGIQNPGAAQDNSTAPETPKDGISEGGTSAHNDAGTNTDSETYSGAADV